MSKKNIGIILLLIFCLLPQAVFGFINSSNGSSTNPDLSVQNIKKVIGDSTPDFISKPIVQVVLFMEDFRKNTFNNGFIFYSLLIIIFILIVRFFWRLFF